MYNSRNSRLNGLLRYLTLAASGRWAGANMVYADDVWTIEV